MHKYLKQTTIALVLVGLTSQIGLSTDQKEESTKRKCISESGFPSMDNFEEESTSENYPMGKKSKYTKPKDETPNPLITLKDKAVDLGYAGMFHWLPLHINHLILSYGGAKDIYSTCNYFRNLVKTSFFPEHPGFPGCSRIYFTPPNEEYDYEWGSFKKGGKALQILESLGTVHTVILNPMVSTINNRVLRAFCNSSGICNVSCLVMDEVILKDNLNFSLLGKNIQAIYIQEPQGSIRGIDFSPLRNITTLSISFCDFEHTRYLGGVKNLSLVQTWVSDVSALGNVSELNLNSCSEVKDISMLMNVKKLTVSIDLNGNLSEMGISENDLIDLKKTNPKIEILREHTPSAAWKLHAQAQARLRAEAQH